MITVKKVVFSVVVTNQSGALLPYAYYALQLKLYLQERLPSILKFFMAYFSPNGLIERQFDRNENFASQCVHVDSVYIQSFCILPLKLWIPIFSMSLYIVTRYMGAAIKALDFGFEDVISQEGGSCIC